MADEDLSPMKLVFLDFDGVLNHHAWFTKLANTKGARSDPMSSREHAFDPACAARVQRICEATEASIVISSTWRYGRTVMQLREMLREVGITATIIDKTPLPHEVENPSLIIAGVDSRGREIDSWLKATPHEISSFVILDDDRDLEPYLDRHVKTSFHFGGLEDAHVDQALAVLSREWMREVTP